jgi:hypothetical protein
MFNGRFKMKTTAIVLVVLSLLACTVAVSVTYFSDNNCQTSVGGTFQGTANPLVASLNQCVQAVTADSGRTALWVRPTSCSSTTSVIPYFTDNQCANVFPGASTTFNVGTCLTSQVPPGSGSFRVSCSSASSASLPFLVSLIVAAVVAFACN